MKLTEILFEEEHKELNSLVSHSTGLNPAKVLQLYVPNPKNKKHNLKSKANPDAGKNKPNDYILWTSTLNDGNSSEWVEWCKSEQPDWLSNRGFVYQVSSNIVSLQLNNDRDVINVWNIFCDKKDKFDLKTYRKDIQNYKKLVKEFPWDKIAKHFDCVYYKGNPTLDNHFMYGWDCESTVFSTLIKLNCLKK